MLLNYFKTAWRNLWKSRFYTGINILGLAIGLAVGIIILLWVKDELSYDRFNSKANQIYKVNTNATHPFQDNNSVLITLATAKKFFGNDNPIGKVIVADKQYNFTVRGIVQNFPVNSSFKYDVLFPMGILEKDYDNDFWKADSAYFILNETAVREAGTTAPIGDRYSESVRRYGDRHYPLLAKDFIRLVLLAIAIASPIAWYGMHKWLQDFAYRAPINGWIFLMAGLMSLVIALLTISFQSIKAALANPVKSLRTE